MQWQPTVTFSLGWWASVEAVSLVLNCKTTDSEMGGTSLAFMIRSDHIPYSLLPWTFQRRLSLHTFHSSCSTFRKMKGELRAVNTCSAARKHTGVVSVRARNTTKVKGHLLWFPGFYNLGTRLKVTRVKVWVGLGSYRQCTPLDKRRCLAGTVEFTETKSCKMLLFKRFKYLFVVFLLL